MLRDTIRQRRRQSLTVLGEQVEVRALSARELVQLEDALPRGADGKADRLDVLVQYVVACTWDAGGAPCFTADDAAWLASEADGAALKQLFVAACELNGVTAEAGEKNLPSSPTCALPTASDSVPASST